MENKDTENTNLTNNNENIKTQPDSQTNSYLDEESSVQTENSAPENRRAGKDRSSKVIMLAGLSLAGSLVLGGVGGYLGALFENTVNNPAHVNIQNNNKTPNDSIDSEQGMTNTKSSIVDNVTPSIVTISAVTSSGSGTGSGVVLEEGYIVTNAHVVTLEGLTEDAVLTVQNSQGQTAPAELVGYDPESDLAVIKTELSNLTPVSFGDSSKLEIEEETIAVGSPLGLTGTVTTGIVSALDRSITLNSSEVMEPELNNPVSPWEPQISSEKDSISLNVIQTDAAINSGNSGGGLFNSKGELIGVNVAIASSGQESGSIGLGFAIPSDYVEQVVEAILNDGQRTHGFLGVSVTDYKENVNSVFTNGVKIETVTDDSPAQTQGLKTGDVIINVNGKPVLSSTQFVATVRQTEPGETLKLGFKSGETLNIKLGEEIK